MPPWLIYLLMTMGTAGSVAYTALPYRLRTKESLAQEELSKEARKSQSFATALATEYELGAEARERTDRQAAEAAKLKMIREMSERESSNQNLQLLMQALGAGPQFTASGMGMDSGASYRDAAMLTQAMSGGAQGPNPNLSMQDYLGMY